MDGSDIADVTCPFAVGCISNEIAIQHISHDLKAIVAVGRHLMLGGANRLDVVDTHQSANTALTHIDADFFKLQVMRGRP